MTGAAFRDGQLESPAPEVISPEPMSTVGHPPPAPVRGLHSSGGGERVRPRRPEPFNPASHSSSHPPMEAAQSPTRLQTQRSRQFPETCESIAQGLLRGSLRRGRHAWGPARGGLHRGASTWGPAPGGTAPGDATPGDPHMRGLHLGAWT